MFKNASDNFLYNSSNLLIVACMEVILRAHVYYVVSMTTSTINTMKYVVPSARLRSEEVIVAHLERMCLTSFPTTNSLMHFS